MAPPNDQREPISLRDLVAKYGNDALRPKEKKPEEEEYVFGESPAPESADEHQKEGEEEEDELTTQLQAAMDAEGEPEQDSPAGENQVEEDDDDLTAQLQAAMDADGEPEQDSPASEDENALARHAAELHARLADVQNARQSSPTPTTTTEPLDDNLEYLFDDSLERQAPPKVVKKGLLLPTKGASQPAKAASLPTNTAARKGPSPAAVAPAASSTTTTPARLQTGAAVVAGQGKKRGRDSEEEDDGSAHKKRAKKGKRPLPPPTKLPTTASTMRGEFSMRELALKSAWGERNSFKKVVRKCARVRHGSEEASPQSQKGKQTPIDLTSEADAPGENVTMEEWQGLTKASATSVAAPAGASSENPITIEDDDEEEEYVSAPHALPGIVESIEIVPPVRERGNFPYIHAWLNNIKPPSPAPQVNEPLPAPPRPLGMGEYQGQFFAEAAVWL